MPLKLQRPGDGLLIMASGEKEEGAFMPT